MSPGCTSINNPSPGGRGGENRGGMPSRFCFGSIGSGPRAVPLSDLFPLREGLGYSFHDAFEAVDKSGVYLYQ